MADLLWPQRKWHNIGLTPWEWREKAEVGGIAANMMQRILYFYSGKWNLGSYTRGFVEG